MTDQILVSRQGQVVRVMLNRPDMTADRARIAAPTLIVAGREDCTGWRPADAQAVADTMADATVLAAAGSGHSSPLLIDRDRVLRSITESWARFSSRADAKVPETPSK